MTDGARHGRLAAIFRLPRLNDAYRSMCWHCNPSPYVPIGFYSNLTRQNDRFNFL